MLRFLIRTCVVGAFAAIAAPLYAQPAQTGTISGTIQDSSGGVIPGVTVTITSQDRGFTRSTVTDASGRFVFPAVPIGSYTAAAALQGFESGQSRDNLVETDKTTVVPFTLKVGALSDTVRVVGDTPIVDITNTAANTRVRREEFEKLPVGRSYQALIATVPGVV